MSKKLMIAALAGLAIAALAVPSMASATVYNSAQWTVNGTALADGSANGADIVTGGELSIQLLAVGGQPTITCDVADHGRIWNDSTDPDTKGTEAYDNIDTFDISNCNTHITGCVLTAAGSNGLPSTPWKTYASIDGTGNKWDEIAGVSIYNTFAASGCGGFNGVTITATGSITAAFDAALQRFTFTGATNQRLSTLYGPAAVSGYDDVCVDDGSGGCTADVIDLQ